MRPRSRGDGPSDVVGSAGPADADSRVFSPRVETRAANSTSESDALDRTSSTVTSVRNWTSRSGASLTPDTLNHRPDIHLAWSGPSASRAADGDCDIGVNVLTRTMLNT